MINNFVGDLLSAAATLLLSGLVLLVRQTNKTLQGMAAERHWLRDTARWTVRTIPHIATQAKITIDPPPAEPVPQTATRS